MPTHTSKDSKGCFAKWGGQGKKYYFTCGDAAARARAVKKANAQGQAAHAHGYTGNKGGHHMPFEYVTTNLQKPLVRQDSMEGKDWIVVPTQMITEGVHNGSDGPIFYPAEELAKIPAVWNHKPVVVYHPEVNGVSVSACEPDQLTTRKVGVLMKTHWDSATKKLGTETWLDPVRMNTVDCRIAEAITKNEMMEVSTGLFMDLERTPGEWNGEKYIGIARNMQPDHLALLPDLKGACSIEDGAGFLRLNEQRRKFVINVMSHDDVRRGLNTILWAKIENAYIEVTYDNHFIYEVEGQLYLQNYIKNDNGVQFDGLPKLVERQVKYVEVISLSENKNKSKLKGNEMDKKKIVDALIDNEKTSWTEEHREKLMAMDDDVLTNMLAPIVALTEELSKATDNKDDKKKEETVTNDKKTEVTTNEQPKPKTMEQYIADAPLEIQDSLRMSVNVMNAEKTRLVETIMANERNTFTKEHLETLKLDMLQAMARLAEIPTDNGPQRIIPLYTGQLDVATNMGKLPEPLKLPTMNFDKKTG